MIEKIARRAGGFASSTALRWVGAGADKVADVAPIGDNGSSHKGGRRAAAVAAGSLAVLSSKPVRSALEHGLRAASKAVRATPSSNSNGHKKNGNGAGKLTEKTRAELYELAKKADLPGRSAMSKDELAKALGL